MEEFREQKPNATPPAPGKKKSRAGYIAWSITKMMLKTLLLLPIPIMLMWFNYTTAATVARKEFQPQRDSALALLSGKALAHGDLLDERVVLTQLIENLEEPFDTIAVGSSRVMQLSSEIAGVDSFYNCGLSGADYRDIMNVYYQFEKADKLPNNMIIALDPWILNADPTKLHAKSNADLFSEFITLRLGYQTGYVPPQTEDGKKWWEYLSLSDLQRNLDYVLNEQTDDIPPDIAEGELEDLAYQVKMPDGTVLYDTTYRNMPQELVDEMARLEATTFLHMDNFQAPDEELCLLFHKFIHYVQSQGVNVIFLLMPYNPIVYTYAAERKDVYPGFFLTEPWFVRYAQMYDIPLYGSYNPFVTDTRETQFFDGLHVKPDGLSSYFPGVPTVLESQKTGTAKSPWLISGPRIRYEVAERIVTEWNEITEPEVVRRGLDEIIEGEVCYLIHRYSDGSDKPIRLATYAISRREGTMYRWDTDLNNWVNDPRFPDPA